MYANVEAETLVNLTTEAQSALTTRAQQINPQKLPCPPSKHRDKQMLIKSGYNCTRIKVNGHKLDTERLRNIFSINFIITEAAYCGLNVGTKCISNEAKTCYEK
jgi:hypothetical protein